MRDLGKIVHAQPSGKIAPGIGEYGLNPVRLRFQFEEGGELRLAAGAAIVQHSLRATMRAASRPRSSSIRARARSMPAVMPAEVHTGPSAMKIRSSSTRTLA